MAKTITERARVYAKIEESGTSKAGKPWSKTTCVFVVSENVNSERYIPVSFFGDEQEDVAVLKKGDIVDIEYYVTGREWQGRWFTEVKVFSCRFPDDDVNTASRKQAEQYKDETLEPQAEDLPF